jgi:hypothetical protein
LILEDWDQNSLSSVGTIELRNVEFTIEVENLIKLEEMRENSNMLNVTDKEDIEKIERYYHNKVLEKYVKLLTTIYQKAINLSRNISLKENEIQSSRSSKKTTHNEE